MGHVQQSTTFADVLRDKGEISFLTKSDEVVAAEIGKAGFGVTRLPSDAEIFRHLTELDPDITIFDKIDVSEQLARNIKDRLRTSISIFTNLTAANRYADVAVTAGIGSQFRNISYTDAETGTRYYFGPKYWILRPQFYEYKKRRKTPPRGTDRIVFLFGGSDPANLTCTALAEFLGWSRPFKIDVIIGALYSHEVALRELLFRHPEKSTGVVIHKNITNVAELMYKSDLAIVSPGLSTFESLIVGTPVLVIPQNEMQRDVFRGFMSMVEQDQIAGIRDKIAHGEFTYPQEENVRMMEIGEGVDELRDVILNSVRRSDPSTT
jgi:spore coat polysaccharide biosynthesis predicted glycosyltransferase SpsG